MDLKPPRPALPPDALTLPAKYYTDPAVFLRELERFYFGMWVCAGRADHLPNAGDYFLRDVGGESLIVARAGGDVVRAFYNVCRHRGTRLTDTVEGCFPGSIQCPYHAWTYDLDGRLVGAPHMDAVPHFDRANYPLRQAALEVWNGHIFINLASSPSPLADHLGPLAAKFTPWGMERLRLGTRRVYDVRANWKLIVQNYSECLHCPVIHPQLNQLSHYLSGENEPAHPTWMGGRMDLRDGVETMSIDGRRRRACLPGLDAGDRRRVYYYAIFPNLLLNLHPDYMVTFTLWPRAVDRTEVVCEWHFDPDEMERPGFDQHDAVEFWDLTNRQDWRVSELAQLGIASRAYAPGPYSNQEELLYAFDRIVKDDKGSG